MSSQSNVGQQVEAQGVAGALAGERSHGTLTYPLTGDAETELMAAVTVAASIASAHVSLERVASVFDFMAKRYRDAAREIERQRDALKQPPSPPLNISKILEKYGNAAPVALNTPAYAGTLPPAAGTPNWPGSTDYTPAEAMRDEPTDKMLSHLNKTTLR